MTVQNKVMTVIKPITKKCMRLENPNDVKKALDELIKSAKENRKGPVWLEVPLDIQSAYINTDEIEDDSIKLVIEKLKMSKRPLILAGQGIREFRVNSRFKWYTENWEIPIILSRMGLSCR